MKHGWYQVGVKQMVEELGFVLKGVTSLYKSRTTYCELLYPWLYLYPWHLCRRVYSFRLSVRSLVGSFILPLCLWNFMSNFMLKFLQVGISLQLLIRKHSYLDHGRVCFPTIKFWPQGSCPGMGPEVKKTRTPCRKCYTGIWPTCTKYKESYCSHPVVHARVHCVKVLCSFFFLNLTYLDSHSSESIHIWTIGTLEGWLWFHDCWLQGPCPRVGLEVKI